MWGIIALIAIYLIINSGRIYIQRSISRISFKILHIHTYIYKYLYIHIAPVKKISDIFWKTFIIAKNDNIFMVNTAQKYDYKNKGKIFTLYVNINC